MTEKLIYTGGKSRAMSLSMSYEELLGRLMEELKKVKKGSKTQRIELPRPDVIWVGNRTILRNFTDYSKLLRRDPDRMLMYMAKRLATLATRDGERAIFVGRKDVQSIEAVINRYIKDVVICPACGSWDTKLERIKRLTFIVCEACGARSPARVD